jgi:hypothetical protein
MNNDFPGRIIFTSLPSDKSIAAGKNNSERLRTYLMAGKNFLIM